MLQLSRSLSTAESALAAIDDMEVTKLQLSRSLSTAESNVPAVGGPSTGCASIEPQSLDRGIRLWHRHPCV